MLPKTTANVLCGSEPPNVTRPHNKFILVVSGIKDFTLEWGDFTWGDFTSFMVKRFMICQIKFSLDQISAQ